MAKIDSLVMDLLADWNTYTTLIAGAIAAFVLFSIVSSKDPDLHPYLLARQASSSPVRNPGESAKYRSLETPYDFPLRSGLNVKDPDTPKWTSGRRGDLRDIWKTAVRGTVSEDGTRKQGKIYTVLGRHVTERSFEDVTEDINVIGKFIEKTAAKTVAICLTDSVELLVAIFAGAFYGFKVALIPHNLASEVLSAHLRKAQADILIAEAGALDLSIIANDSKELSHVIWVAKDGSRHMAWNQLPPGVRADLKVAVWHELVEEKRDLGGLEVPSWDPKTPSSPLSTLQPSSGDTSEFIDYQPENLASAIGALISCLPAGQRFGSGDLVLSIDSLSRLYPLCQIFAALYSNASIALNSVTGDTSNFALATVGVSPTVVITSSRTVSQYHKRFMRPNTGIISKFARWIQIRSLDAGVMSSHNLLSQLATAGPTAELSLNKLRLLCISHRAGDSSENCLTSEQLTDLRIFTGARVVYALTAPGVAGAICQTNIFDYRRFPGPCHFGPPLSSVEVLLTDVPREAESDRPVEGKITVSGPAVVSGKTTIPIRGHFREDNTLELLP